MGRGASMDTADENVLLGWVFEGATGALALVEAILDGSTPPLSGALMLLRPRSFSDWTAALRPRRVKGRFARPISCECWDISE